MTKPKDPAEKKAVNPTPPKVEWVLTDIDSIAGAIRGMMGARGLIQERLAQRMGGRNLFSNLFHGKAKDVRAMNLVAAAEAMGFEVVIREPSTSASKRRLEGLRLEAVQLRAAKAAQAAEKAKLEADEELLAVAPEEGLSQAGVTPERDEQGKLTRPLTEAERAEVEKLLGSYTFTG